MKKLFTILVPMAIGILLTSTLWAQSPEKMSYQAVIRDLDENLVTNQTVGMQIRFCKVHHLGQPFTPKPKCQLLIPMAC